MQHQKERYLICVDLDSTLLDDKKQISDKTVAYFQKLVKDEHIIILNSGRPYQGAIPHLKRLGINFPIIFCDGGGILYLDGDYNVIDKELFLVKKEDVIKLYNEFEKDIIAINLIEFDNQFYNDRKVIPDFMFHDGPNIKYYEGRISDILFCDVINIICVVTLKGNKKFKEALDKIEDISYFNYGEYDEVSVYEIAKKGVNKGSTLLALANRYGIDYDHIIAIGDSFNDIEMIKVAKYSCAMVNASDSLKKYAKYTTKYDSNHDGVMHFLKTIIK